MTQDIHNKALVKTRPNNFDYISLYNIFWFQISVTDDYDKKEFLFDKTVVNYLEDVIDKF